MLAMAPAALCQEKAPETGKEASAGDPWIWWKWANFVMLAGVLGYLANKSAGAYFSGQTQEIQRGIAEAGKVKAEAEARAAEIEKRLAGMEAEIGRLKSQAQTEMEAEAIRLKDETLRLLERLHQQTQQEVELLTKAAKHELKTFSADLSLNLAEQKIRALLDPAGRENLVSSFIQDLHNGDQHRTITQ